MSIQVIAHRGASSYAPENTIPAFDLALAMGANGLETDIRVTRDRVPVLIHDRELDRTTDGQGLLAAWDWEAVQKLDAGVWFAPEFSGARILRLGEFIRRYLGKTHLALEIKDEGISQIVMAELTDVSAWERITITSFQWKTLESVADIRPGTRLGWLCRAFDQGAIERVAVAGWTQICPPAALAKPHLVRSAQDQGLEVRAWRVDDEALMRRMVAVGVDGMTVNFPDKLVAYLGREAS